MLGEVVWPKSNGAPPGLSRRHATREEHVARHAEARRLLVEIGLSGVQVENRLSEQYGISNRQAHRYVKAVRLVQSRHDPGPDSAELRRILLARAEAAITGDSPDHKAGIKALELYARVAGMLDRRSTIDVNVTGTVAHVAALDGYTDAEIAALQAIHDGAQRRLAEGRPVEAQALIDTTATVDAEPTDG